jgi:hypothetical protein
MSIEIVPTAAALGAEICGVNLARPIDDLLQANGASFVDQAYVDAYQRFLDDTQDPILGYWGPWGKSSAARRRSAAASPP